MGSFSKRWTDLTDEGLAVRAEALAEEAGQTGREDGRTRAPNHLVGAQGDRKERVQ